MSLKSFHIVFIGFSVILALGVAAWTVQLYLGGSGPGTLVAGTGSLLIGMGLILYGIRFLRKLKHVSYL